MLKSGAHDSGIDPVDPSKAESSVSVSGSQGLVRFGPYEMRSRTQELFKQGLRLKLPPQSFQVLRILVERPGQLVTREDLQQVLWSGDTFVDFDHGLNNAIKRIRDVLNDSADAPVFIETLPRLGYRFIAPVSHTNLRGQVVSFPLAPGPGDPAGQSAEPVGESNPSRNIHEVPSSRSPLPTPRKRSLARPAIVATLLVAVSTAGSLIYLHRRPKLTEKDAVVGHSHPELTERQLTSNSSEDVVQASAISPDGKYLAYVDQTGLLARSLDSGETRLIFLPADFPAGQIHSILWLPDGGKLLVTRATPEMRFSLWVVAVLGQAPPQLLRPDARSPTISPDGKSIALLSGGIYQPEDLWVSGVNGEKPNKLAVRMAYHGFAGPSWSPDGKWIAYFHMSFPESGSVRQFTIEAQPTSGGVSKVLVSNGDLGRKLTLEPSSLHWSPDWRLIFGVADATSPREQRQHTLWQVHVNSAGLRSSQPPQQLTTFRDSNIQNLSATDDGKRLALLETRIHQDVYLAELQAGNLKTPRRFTLDNHDSRPDLWTRDSQSILFVSSRNGKNELFKQGLNDSVPQKLESGPIADVPDSSGLTPDGEWLLFFENPPRSSGEQPQLPVRLMRQPIGGGPAEQVLEMPYGEGMTANLRCPFRPGKPCVLEELSGKNRDNVLFYPLDPIRGKGDLLGSIQLTSLHWLVGWALSPEGSQVAVVGNKDRIEILNLSAHAWHAITVEPGWGDLQSISWDAGEKGFLLTTVLPESFNLIHVTLLGKVQPLLNNAHRQWIVQPLPSPDGRYLAFQAQTTNSNVWLLENF